MNLAPHQIIKSPVITEESQIQQAKANQYTFTVHPAANKLQIRDAIEAIFTDVKVVRVNTMNVHGKVKRQMGSRKVGRSAKRKKALVTLRDGDTIDLI